jgi:hypothetical protein
MAVGNWFRDYFGFDTAHVCWGGRENGTEGLQEVGWEAGVGEGALPDWRY